MDQEPAVAVEAARAAGVERLICVGVDLGEQPASLEMADSLRGRVRHGGGPSPRRGRFRRARRPGGRGAPARPARDRRGGVRPRLLPDALPGRGPAPALATHVALSNAAGKPMVVHVRDAWDDTLEVLERVRRRAGRDPLLQRRRADREGVCGARVLDVLRRERHVPEERAPAPGGASGRRPTASSSRPTRPTSRRRSSAAATTRPQNVLVHVAELARVRDDDVDEMVSRSPRRTRAAFPGLR